MREPDVSVVIPSRSRPHALDECLGAIEGQASDIAFEVIVVDDGSASPIAPANDTLDLRVARIPHAGPSAARNVGAGLARGEIIAFTDDDCRPEPGWLAAISAALDRHPDAIVAGIVRNGLPRNLFAETSQVLVAFLVDYYEDGLSSRFFTSNNIAMRRSTFAALGGFDTEYTRAAAEDRELCARALDCGVPVVVDHDIVVVHYHDLSAASFVRQHYRYGRGAHRYHRARRTAGGGRTPEPAQFYLRLGLEPLKPRPTSRGALIASLLCVSQIAHAAGYLVERSPGSS